jgi:uncharacterized protein YggT (Ycf19 family)
MKSEGVEETARRGSRPRPPDEGQEEEAAIAVARGRGDRRPERMRSDDGGAPARKGLGDVALFLLILQTLILVAGLSLVGQFVVAVFNWNRRRENIVYQIFDILTRPLVRLMRRITPRVIVDQHVPLATFFVLLFGYFAVGLWHRDVCLADLAQAGCERWAAVYGGAAK